MSRRRRDRSRGGDGEGEDEDEGGRGLKRGRNGDESDADEYDADRVEKKARLYVEESLTESVVRRCPSCRTAIVKGAGCGHVTCLCGEDFCFLCGRRWERCAMNCRYRVRTLARAAQRACEKLRRRYPRLTFRQCQTIIGRKWTEGGDEGGMAGRGRGRDEDDDYDDDVTNNN